MVIVGNRFEIVKSRQQMIKKCNALSKKIFKSRLENVQKVLGFFPFISKLQVCNNIFWATF